jgi:predicted metal-dependent enzyme (double-stranded beta helix superfamily)
MFVLHQFIEDCRQCLGEQNSHAAVRDVVGRAASEPGQIIKTLGEPRLSGIQTLYRSDALTILNVLWGPGMTLYPHDHRMWAVIGIYSGREVNSFYRRSENGLVAHGAKTLDLKETLPLGEAVIHAVTNPLDQVTAAIHVYGGDFFAVPRSEWDPQTLQERPFDIERAKEVFAEANRHLVSPEMAPDAGKPGRDR